MPGRVTLSGCTGRQPLTSVLYHNTPLVLSGADTRAQLAIRIPRELAISLLLLESTLGICPFANPVSAPFSLSFARIIQGPGAEIEKHGRGLSPAEAPPVPLRLRPLVGQQGGQLPVFVAPLLLRLLQLSLQAFDLCRQLAAFPVTFLPQKLKLMLQRIAVSRWHGSFQMLFRVACIIGSWENPMKLGRVDLVGAVISLDRRQRAAFDRALNGRLASAGRLCCLSEGVSHSRNRLPVTLLIRLECSLFGAGKRRSSSRRLRSGSPERAEGVKGAVGTAKRLALDA